MIKERHWIFAENAFTYIKSFHYEWKLFILVYIRVVQIRFFCSSFGFTVCELVILISSSNDKE